MKFIFLVSLFLFASGFALAQDEFDFKGKGQFSRSYAARIDSIQEWSAVDKRAIKLEASNGGAEYYFLRDSLLKIVLWQTGDKVGQETQFYILNGKIVLVSERPLRASDSLKVAEKTYLFHQDKLIDIQNRLNDVAEPSSANALYKEEARLKSIFQQLIKRLRRVSR